jgi:hypothetical protein
MIAIKNGRCSSKKLIVSCFLVLGHDLEQVCVWAVDKYWGHQNLGSLRCFIGSLIVSCFLVFMNE